MAWRALASALVLAWALTPARGEPAACAGPDGDLRQACRLAAALPEPGSSGTPGDPIGTNVTAPLSPRDFRTVPQSRLVADPGAVLRQPVAVAAARCFAFGVGDYRCVVPDAGPVAVSAPIVIPPGAQVAVEHGCTAGGTSPGPGCASVVRFVPQSFRSVEASGRTVVLFRAGSIMIDDGASP